MSAMDKFEHGGKLYAAAWREGGTVQELLDFSVNINPFGLPESVRQAVKEALEHIVNYPDATATLLKAALAKRYSLERDMFSVGNGAAELMYVLCHRMRPKRVLIPAPTFSEYERAARSSGAAIKYVSLNAIDGFALNTGEIINQLSQVDLVFLCNPNNPTGRIEEREKLAAIIAAAHKSDTYVVIDESFIDFVTDNDLFTCKPLVAKYPKLIILQSMTKTYAIPGLRLGFAIADNAIIQLLDSGKDPWNVNSLAQAAGVAALDDAEYLKRSVEAVTLARQTMIAELRRVPGFTPYPGAANYLLVNIAGSGFNAPRLGQALWKYNIIIRDCSNYPGLSPDYIRLAVKLASQNGMLVATLLKLCKDGAGF
ncbi:MAG: L-threonine-O-3-phosphate decarboxylase [Firmicutes bacterium]|nr:L-threonine-O-3-phosphate decarboxylase [Bacillota bacterium]